MSSGSAGAETIGAARQAFLLAFSDRVRDLIDPSEILRTAATMLCEHLRATHGGCVEAVTNEASIQPFGRLAGTLVIEDARTHLEYSLWSARACIAVPDGLDADLSPLTEQHDIVTTPRVDAVALFASAGMNVESMGRPAVDDPWLFECAASAGVVAAERVASI